VSGFVKGAWSAAAPSLQAVFNRDTLQALFTRASNAFAALVGSSSHFTNHLQNVPVVVITSVTVVVLFVVKKVRGSTTRSDTVVVVLEKGHGYKDLMAAYEPIIQKDAKTLDYDAFVAKHGEKAIDFLDEATKSLLHRPSGPVIEEVLSEEVSVVDVSPSPAVTSSDRANALALHLKSINGDIRTLRAVFERDTLFKVTDPEGIEYIGQIFEDALRRKTITYPQLRPLLDLEALAILDPNTPRMQLLRNFFHSFEGRFANLYEEDRRIFRCETNVYVLWHEMIQERSRARSTAVS